MMKTWHIIAIFMLTTQNFLAVLVYSTLSIQSAVDAASADVKKFNMEPILPKPNEPILPKPNYSSQFKNLVNTGKYLPTRALGYSRDKYNSAVQGVLDSIRPLLIAEIPSSLGISKQYIANMLLKNFGQILARLLDVAPMGTMPENYRPKRLGSVISDAVLPFVGIPGNIKPSKKMPGEFPPPQLPPRPNGHPTQASSNQISTNAPQSFISNLSNSFKTVFGIPANTATSDKMPGSLPPPKLPSRLAETNVQNAQGAKDQQKAPVQNEHATETSSSMPGGWVKGPRLYRRNFLDQVKTKVLSLIHKIVSTDAEQIITLCNEKFDSVMTDFLATNILAHMKERLTWAPDKRLPNPMILARLDNNAEVQEIQKTQGNLDQNANGQGESTQQTQIALGKRKTLLRNLIMRSVDSIFFQLDPDIKSIVKKTTNNAMEVFPWLIYNVVLDTIEKYTGICKGFKRPDLGNYANQAMDIGSNVLKWSGKIIVQLYHSSGLASSDNKTFQTIRQLAIDNPNVCGLIRQHLGNTYKLLNFMIIVQFESVINLLSKEMHVLTVKVLKMNVLRKVHVFLPIFPDQF
ncbi:hypothetical protein BDF19DRAFT_466010 [Syncephalis fuscata]|nr:hypothetical protein BDF19DRAFT_466010 [Syncephalis fuscata]